MQHHRPPGWEGCEAQINTALGRWLRSFRKTSAPAGSESVFQHRIDVPKSSVSWLRPDQYAMAPELRETLADLLEAEARAYLAAINDPPNAEQLMTRGWLETPVAQRHAEISVRFMDALRLRASLPSEAQISVSNRECPGPSPSRFLN